MAQRLTRRRLLSASAGTAGALALGGTVFPRPGSRGAQPELRAAAAARASVTRRGMNVVLVCLDSVRADHVGAYGRDGLRPDRAVQTPSIDELAAGALRFTRARPEHLPTGPTRRSVHTGVRTFPADDWQPDPDSPRLYGWQHIRPHETTLHELLGAAGYRTALVTDNTWLLKPSWLPFSTSWDDFVAIEGQVQQGLRPGRTARTAQAQRFLPSGMALLPDEKVANNRDVIARYLANSAPRRREEDWLAPRVFRAATRWLERRGDDRRPFFLHIDSFDPHEPWDPPRRYVDRYDDPEYRGVDPIHPPYGRADVMSPREQRRMRALYAGELTMVDHWLGTFLERLDELGLAQRTLVVLFSDHGVSLADRRYVGKSPTQMYAEMMDVPLLVRHPEGLGAGTVTDHLAQLHDIAPTVLALAGVPAPEAMEGHDLSPLLAGAQPAQTREVQTAGYNDHVWASDGRYVFTSTSRRSAERLYDRVHDPEELHNVSSEHRGIADRLWDAIVRDAGGREPPLY